MGRARMAKQLLAADWGVDLCTTCGATIVVGEPVMRTTMGGRPHTLCSACAVKPEGVLLARRGSRSSSAEAA